MFARAQQTDRAIVVFLVKILNLNFSLEILALFEDRKSRDFALDVIQSLILLELEVKLKVFDPLSLVFALLCDLIYILSQLREIIL